MTITAMGVEGIKYLVERAFRESGRHQYLRELTVNAIEAGATRIEFGPEWQHVEHQGVYRLMVADNGKGMSPKNLLKFLNTFGGGGKPIGDAHENYGIGAKTSLMPWNKAGLIVISYTPAWPEGQMLRLMRDKLTGEYGAERVQTEDGDFTEVTTPQGLWAKVKPSFIQDHGTVVVACGDTGSEDTFFGREAAEEVKWISDYLNKRFWTMPTTNGAVKPVDIVVTEFSHRKRANWPKSQAAAAAQAMGYPRRVRGARYYVRDIQGTGEGALGQEGQLVLADGTKVDWYLWDGVKPSIDSYAYDKGYIAALYKNELYDVQQHHSTFRTWGITQGAVRERLTLIVSPPHGGDGKYGVYPDTARNALKIQGSDKAGEPLPWAEWGAEFALNLPEPIKEALAKAGPQNSGTLDDEKWRQVLAQRFWDRWQVPRGRRAAAGDSKTGAGMGSGGLDLPGGRGSGGQDGNSKARKDGKDDGAQKNPGGGPLGANPANQTRGRAGIPNFQWVTMFEVNGGKSQQYAAVWNASHKPFGLVQLARDFPTLVETKAHWRERYPDHMADEVDHVVEQTYGEVLVSRIAHAQSLASRPDWTTNTVNDQLCSSSALTFALMGLYAEEQLILARLSGALGGAKPTGKTRRKRMKTAATPPAAPTTASTPIPTPIPTA